MSNMQRKTIDERFTDLADTISEVMGKWWVSVVSIVLIVVWTLYCMVTQGSSWWYGTFYNLPLNLVTTVAELFIGFLLGAAANRTEKRNRQLHQQMFASEQQMLALGQQMFTLEQRIIDLMAKEEQEITQIEQDLSEKVVRNE